MVALVSNQIMTLPDFLLAGAKRWPNRIWCRTPEGDISRGEVVERALHVAGGLRYEGLEPGQRVVVAVPNSVGFLVAWFGAILAGCPVLAVNPRATAAELKSVTEGLRPEAVIVLDGDVGEIGSLLGPPGPGTPPVLALSRLEGGPRSEPHRGRPEEEVAYLQTSGSSGAPKFIIRTHAMYTLAAEAFPWWLGLVDRDVMLTTLPLAHGNAQLYSVLGSYGVGASLVLLPRFSATSFWEEAAAYGATQFNAIGSMLEILTRREPSPAEKEHRIRLCYTAPAPPRTRHLEIEERFNIHLVIGWSQSEAGGFGLIMPLQGPDKYGSMGRPRQHPRLGQVTRARVVDVSGAEVGPGEVGELEISNPTTTPGYLDQPEQSAALLRDGWLRTGDLAWYDEDGYYYFGGRSKELIRHKGENLSPAEVERVLEEHPNVAAAAVIGVPSDLAEEDVKAFVVVRAGARADAADLFAWCDDRLPPYKRPRYLEFVTDLPTTENHKVAKAQLSRDRNSTEFEHQPVGGSSRG